MIHQYSVFLAFFKKKKCDHMCEKDLQIASRGEIAPKSMLNPDLMAQRLVQALKLYKSHLLRVKSFQK